MVGIVVVSHSCKIAQGIKDVASQMADKSLKIIAAGGLQDGKIGTDAARIFEAVTEADSGDGVIITVDLGSAVLSANMALNMLEEEQRKRVLIADAPIVEGTINAAIIASVGEPLKKVKAAAEETSAVKKLD